MFHRGSRGSRRGGMRPSIQSFKKVINIAPGSVTAGTRIESISLGIDSVAAGQTTALDVNVPTGAKIKYILIQHALGSISGATPIIHVSIQGLHAGQSVVGPDVVGGDDQRNQVFYQDCYGATSASNSNHRIKFKVPPRFQRVRAGDTWSYVWKTNGTVTSAVQIIYKFYR